MTSNNNDNIELYLDPNRYAEPGKIELGDIIKFSGYQTFDLSDSYIEINPKDKGLVTKKGLTNSIFYSNWIQNKSVLDIGSNSAYFCYHSLFKGASHATAVEMDPIYAGMIRAAKNHIGIKNLSVEEKNVMDISESADLVLAFALIHWIYSCTSDYGSLDLSIQKLASLTNELLVIEWIEPDDDAIKFFKHTEWNKSIIKEEYSKKNFENALTNHFDSWEYVGDIKSTRKLYFAYKNPTTKNEINDSYLGLPLQDIFISLNELGEKYTILRNKEIILNNSDKFNDLTIDILFDSGKTDNISQLFGNSNISKVNGFNTIQFEIGEYNSQKIYLNLRIISNNDEFINKESKNIFLNNITKTNGISHLTTEFETLYLVFYSLYYLGAMDNTYSEVIRELSLQSGIKISSKNINNFIYLNSLLNQNGITKVNENNNLAQYSFPYINPIQTTLQSRYLCWINGIFYISRIYKYLENDKLIIQKQANKDIATNEFKILNSLNSIYFPKVFEFQEQINSTSFKMEYIEGKSLSEVKTLTNLLSNQEIKDFISDLLKILKELKFKNITHRDISPSNILIRNKLPVLIDFGWAESKDIVGIDAPGLGGVFKPKDGSFSDIYSMGKVITLITNGLVEYSEIVEIMTNENSLTRINDISKLIQLVENIKVENSLEIAINLVEKGKKLIDEENIPFAYNILTEAKSLISNKEAAEIGIFFLIAYCEYLLGNYEQASENITTEMILNPENLAAFELDDKINQEIDKLENAEIEEFDNDFWEYDVSIIIPVFNRIGITENCIVSIYENTKINFELIVIDNGSDNNTKERLELLASKYNFILIRNETNLGFAFANNQGIKSRNGKNVFLLNNDTIVTPNWLESSIELMTEKNCGIVGSCLLYPDSEIIQHIGVIIGTEDGKTIAPYHCSQYYNISEVENISRKVSAVTGAAFLISQNLLDAIGGLDEGYINGLEDIDYCFKASSVGAEIWYNAKSIIYHYESLSKDRHKYDIQNWQRLNQKWLGKINFDETQSETNHNVKLINQKKYELNDEIINYSNQYVENVNNTDVKEQVTNPYDEIEFSFIIPVHNNLQYTKKCIDSIYKTSAFYSFEVIIINNASTDETAGYLHSLGNLVKVISNSENKSYSKANNQGAELAKGKYLIFINNDVEIQPGSLEAIKSGYNEDNNIAIQGAKLIYPNGLIQHAGVVWGAVSEDLNLHYHIYLAANPTLEWVNKKREFQMLTGAFLTIKKDIFEQINGFDENYFFGHEDLDLCLKAREKNYKVVYNPEIVGIHHESITKKSEGINKFERFIKEPDSYDAKNHKYFLSKWEHKIILDAHLYYLEDGIYGLSGEPEKLDLFQSKLRELFELLKNTSEELYQRKAKKVSEILFNNPSYDFVANVNLLLNTSYERILKAIDFVVNGELEPENRTYKIIMTMYGWNDSGGGTIFPRDVAIQLVKEGYEVLVIYAGVNDVSSEEKYLIKEWEDEGVKLCGIYNREIKFINPLKPEFEIYDPEVSSIFEAKLKEFNPDIVHFNNFVGLSFNIARIAKNLGYKTLYTPFNYHLIDPKLYMINSNLEKWNDVDLIKNSEELKTNPGLKDSYLNRIEAAKQVLNQYVDMTLAVSTRVKNLLIEFGCREERITIINQVPKSANELDFNNDAENIHSPIKIGYIGGVMAHKGVHNLVLATSMLPEANAELNIYGFVDSAYKNLLQSLESKVPVHIKGEYKFSELKKISQNIDIAVLPSIWEDCAPFAILESLSMGIPVIAPNIGGFSDFIEDNYNGKIYKYNDVKELALILNDLISNPSKIIELRKNAKLSFKFQEHINHLKHVYSRTYENTLLPLEIEYLFKQKLNIPKNLSTEFEDKNEIPNQVMNRTKQESSKIGGFSNNNAIGKLPNILPSPLNLNLGCGKDVKQNFVNIDLFSDNPEVVNMDIRHLELADNSADFILASDVLEHFSHRETQSILKEWNRVLKENAEIEIRCPNLKLQLQAYMRGDWDADVASYMIFGGQTNPGDYHCIGFDKNSISKHLINAGFEIISYQEHDFPQNQGYINLNMTIKARKKSRKDLKYHQVNIKNNITKNNNDKDKQEVKLANYNPQLNIVWEGSQFIYHSLALINREISLNLIKSGQANLTIIPYEDNTFDPSIDAKFELLNKYHLDNKVDTINTDDKPYVWIRHQWPPKNEIPEGAKWIIMQPWEYTTLRQDVYDVLKNADEIWTPSTFSREAMINSGLDFDKVQIIPNGIDPNIFKPFGEKLELNTDAKIKFLFVGGTLPRKGIDILLKSFVKTFTKNDPVALVIKDIGGKSFYIGQTAQEQINTLQQNPNAPEIIYIDDDLTENEMAALYRSCDVFVSPYRGEGFCLPALEAMACGLPVIVTENGATDDFVDEFSGWKIKSRLEALDTGEIKYVKQPYYLEPDEEDLHNILLNIYQNPNYIKHLGRIASFKARKLWTWEKATDILLTRLDFLYDTSMSKEYRKQIKTIDDDYFKLGEAEYLINQFNNLRAIELLNEISDDNLIDYANLVKALIAIQEGEIEYGKEIIQELDNQKYNVDIAYLKTLILISEDNHIEALETINPIVENWIENKWKTNFALSLDSLIQIIGDCIYFLDDYTSAEKIYDSSIQNNYNNLSAHIGKAKSMFNLDKKTEAIDYLINLKNEFDEIDLIDELIEEMEKF